jgi:hypothetical protein
MSGLPPDPTGLGAILGDPEVRRMVGDLVARKLKADLEALRGGAELLGRWRVGPDGGPARAAAPGEGVMKELVRLQLEYYGALIDMTTEFHERTRALLGVEPSPGAPDGAPDPEMRLSGPPGSTVRSAFRVENTTTAPMSVELVAGPFRRDGTDEEATPAVAFDPPRAELTPGQEAQISVIVPVGKDLAPGATYRGTIGAAGVDSVRIAVRLDVEPPPPRPKRPPAKTPATTTPAAKTPAAKTPAAKKPAAKRPAAKTPARKRAAPPA